MKGVGKLALSAIDRVEGARNIDFDESKYSKEGIKFSIEDGHFHLETKIWCRPTWLKYTFAPLCRQLTTIFGRLSSSWAMATSLVFTKEMVISVKNLKRCL
eukprot:UN16111